MKLWGGVGRDPRREPLDLFFFVADLDKQADAGIFPREHGH